MDRREMIGLGLAGALVSGAGEAQIESGALPGDSKEFVELWPGTPPGGEGITLNLKVTDAIQPDGFHVRAVSQIQTPGFFIYRAVRPNGLGLLIIPGGGYAREGGDRGGREIAQHFSSLGITCFVLRYRLPGEGWKNRSSVPLQDAQRAMRLIRAGAYGVTKLAAIGFSAGGHLSASLATRHGMPTYTPVDAADQTGRQAHRCRAYVSRDHHGAEGRIRARVTSCWATTHPPRRWPTGRWKIMSAPTRRRLLSVWRRMTM